MDAATQAKLDRIFGKNVKKVTLTPPPTSDSKEKLRKIFGDNVQKVKLDTSGTFGFGKPPLPQDKPKVSGLGGLLQAKLQGQTPQVQSLNKIAPAPPSENNFALGALGADVIKGMANPASLRGNSELSKGLNNFNAQGVASATDALTNTADFLTKGGFQQVAEQSNPDIAEPSWLKKRTAPLTQNIRQESNKRNQTDENSISTIAGDLTGQIVGSLPAMGGAGALIKGAGLESEALQNSSKLAKLAGFVGRSAINTSSATVPTSGRLANAQEFGTGLGIDTILHGVGSAANKLSEKAYEKVLGLSRGEKGKFTEKGLNLGKTLSEKGYIASSREDLAKKIGVNVSQLSDTLESLIQKADQGDESALIRLGGKTGFTSGDLVDNVKDKVFQSPKLKPKFGEMKQVQKQIDQSLNEFKNTVGKKSLTLSDVQNLKKKLGNSLSGLLSKSGDAKGTAKELVNDVIRDNAKNIIENNVKGAGYLNKKMAPLIEAKKFLQKKGNYSGYLSDIIVGSGTLTGDVTSGKSPDQIATDIIKNILIKRALTSTAGRTLGGRVLNDSAKVLTSQVLNRILKNAMFSSGRGK